VAFSNNNKTIIIDVAATVIRVNSFVKSDFGIVTGYRLGGRGSISGSVKRFFSNRFQTGSGDHPASYPMGTDRYFPGGEAAGA
jgi:hypothetical protein